MARKVKLHRPNSKIDDAWLGLGNLHGKTITNPLLGRDQEYIENPGLLEIKLMRNPEYLSFAAKTLLDVELLPVQSMIIEELWKRTFPMYIASRGFGKLFPPGTLVRTKNGWTPIEKIRVGYKAYGGDGRLHRVLAKTELQTNVEIYKLHLSDGRSIKACEDHMWTCKINGELGVLTTKQILGRYKNEQVRLITNGPVCEDDNIDLPIHPYLYGILLLYGYMKNDKVYIKNKIRPAVLNKIKALLPPYHYITNTDNGYCIHKKNRLDRSRHIRFLLGKLDFNDLVSQRKIHSMYMTASASQRHELLRAFIDCPKSFGKPNICYTFSSALSNDVVNLCRSLNIWCKHEVIKSIPAVNINTKLVYEEPTITNIEYVGKGEGYCIEIDSPDKTYIVNDYIVTHNSFLLAVYATLRCALIPNYQIVAVGAAFRQSRIIYEYMNKIWSNAPVLRSVCTNSSGPRGGIDRCEVVINDSRAIFLPMGDGSRIRGLRANCIIADEFSCVGRDTLIETNNGLLRISDCFDGESRIINRYGEYEVPYKYIKTPKTDVYKVTTEYGYSFKCSSIHKVLTVGGWKLAKNLTDKDCLVFDNKYIFPNKYVESDGVIVDETFAYNLGNSMPKNGETPNCILRSPKSVVKRFLDGLFGVDCSSHIFRYEANNQLISDIQVLLSKLDIIAEKSVYGKRSIIRGPIDDDSGILRVKSVELLNEQEHLYDFFLPNTNSFYGNGFVQHNSIPPDIYETVIRGFAAVSSKPLDGVKAHSRREAMKKLGEWNDQNESVFRNRATNQCIIAGTPDYDFMHYAEYWRKHYVIIKSGGELDKPVKLPNGEVRTLREYYPDGLDPSFNPADYSIIRIPYELVPRGFMDDKVVMAAKSSSHKSIYLKEYGACKYPGTLIITDDGCKPIEDIVVGDKVLTHKGRFRPVTKCMYRNINEETVKLRFYGYNKYIGSTKDHPWFNGKDFVRCDNIDTGVLVNLSELNNDNEYNGIKLDYRLGKLVGNLVCNNNYDEMPEIFGGNNLHNKYILPQVLYSNYKFLDGFVKGVFDGRSEVNLQSVKLTSQIKTCLSYFGIASSIKNNKNSSSIIIDSHNNKASYFSLQHKFTEHYNGRVYNLEVEEDHSYSTLVGTVHNCFPSDSDGFFKRSLIQSCVTSDTNPINLPSGPVWFDAAVVGNPSYKYVYGVDPAAERDNFSIVILELHEDHTRIVYCWSTNIKDFERRRKAGMAEENDYYGFCARKIRNLMKVFPTENIAIDAQGGGRSILESFHDPHKLQPGELFLWPTNRILNPDKELPTDDEPGLHICHMCQFANFDFTSAANHGTRKDFEDKVLLFPRFDPVTLELAAHQDAQISNKLGVDKLYDTLEDCVMEIEELKDELCTIVMSRTGTGVGGRDRWDTPETVTSEGKKVRMRKDRYSALIMANYIARSVQRAPAAVNYSVIGGFAHQLAAQEKSESKEGELYRGPDWFTSPMNSIIKHTK